MFQQKKDTAIFLKNLTNWLNYQWLYLITVHMSNDIPIISPIPIGIKLKIESVKKILNPERIIPTPIMNIPIPINLQNIGLFFSLTFS